MPLEGEGVASDEASDDDETSYSAVARQIHTQCVRVH